MRLIKQVEGYDDEVKYYDTIIQSTNDYLLAISAPKEFNPTSDENCLVEMDRSFGKLCAVMEANGVNSPSKLSLYEFYHRIDYLERKEKSSAENGETV